MKLAQLTGSMVLAATPCLAEIPQYDTKTFCKDQATKAGVYDANQDSSCTLIEELAVKKLAPMWDALPAALQADCDKTATTLGTGSYSLLQTCVEMKKN